jgi:hypothetical protein
MEMPMSGNSRIKMAMLALALTVPAMTPAHTEDRIALPEIVVGAPTTNPKQVGTPTRAAPASTEHERCVDVTIGDDHSLSCLNEKLKQQVDKVNPVEHIPPVDARSSDLKTGVVNIPGVQQQYGKNFGNSVVPFRPPPPVFTSPLPHR